MSEASVVIGVLHDIHNFGVRVITYALQKAGFKVIDIGSMASHEDYINAAIETGAKAILISSSYGHALIDCQGMREKCQEAGLPEILLYIGGNLVVTEQGQEWADIEQAFQDAGFDRAFPQTTSPEQIIESLRRDLGLA
jgi:methylaspartate mutase sigma subunit